MPYVTIKAQPYNKRIPFEEMLKGNVDLRKYLVSNYTNTHTFYVERINSSLRFNARIGSAIIRFNDFNNRHEALFAAERQSLYHSFKIPKRSGGLRQIDEPNPELMTALRELADMMSGCCFATYHTSAFAYVKGRCCKDAIIRHQRNNSHWFAKLDFSNFFGSTTPEFVVSMLSRIYPFNEILTATATRYEGGRMERLSGSEVLTKSLSLCFLNGGLPQGTPISPLLTNLMMIPIDHTLANTLREYNGQNYVYTRYADDLLISSLRDFHVSDIEDLVCRVLAQFGAPFQLKKEKTRYGSRAGSNWNLGMMLNKDNEITIGHKRKKVLNAMLNSYILDKRAGNGWELGDVQSLAGNISYYRSIEAQNIDAIIDRYNKKYGTDVMLSIKEDLNPHHKEEAHA